jgi:inorganic pyrophosphatase
MDVSKVGCGKKYPNEFNVVIEIPANSPGIKYEFCKDSGAVFVDRFLSTPMHYPENYGFVPNTLSGDGDPVDVLVLSPFALMPGVVIPARAVGVLITRDEKGLDEKVIAVPTASITKEFDNIHDIEDISPARLAKIKHFFEHYKDLEEGKFVKVESFKNANEALSVLEKARL